MLLKGVLFTACAQPTGALLLTLSRISDSWSPSFVCGFLAAFLASAWSSGKFGGRLWFMDFKELLLVCAYGFVVTVAFFVSTTKLKLLKTKQVRTNEPRNSYGVSRLLAPRRLREGRWSNCSFCGCWSLCSNKCLLSIEDINGNNFFQRLIGSFST